MEKKLSDYNDYNGMDADLETSLYEYGLVWKKGIEGHENDYHFIYGVGMQEVNGEIEYNLFDWGNIPVDCNPQKEWDFVKWEDVAKTSGMSVKEFLSMPLPLIVFDLLGYYGYENVFGSSYYSFTIERGN